MHKYVMASIGSLSVIAAGAAYVQHPLTADHDVAAVVSASTSNTTQIVVESPTLDGVEYAVTLGQTGHTDSPTQQLEVYSYATMEEKSELDHTRIFMKCVIHGKAELRKKYPKPEPEGSVKNCHSNIEWMLG